MIKRIFPNKDLEFVIQLLDGNDELINYNLLDVYKITAYTTNIDSGLVYDRADIVDYVLKIDSEDLAKLDDGMLKLRYEVSVKDDSYEDGNYSKIGELITRWYVYIHGNECDCGCKC